MPLQQQTLRQPFHQEPLETPCHTDSKPLGTERKECVCLNPLLLIPTSFEQCIKFLRPRRGNPATPSCFQWARVAWLNARCMEQEPHAQQLKKKKKSVLAHASKAYRFSSRFWKESVREFKPAIGLFLQSLIERQWKQIFVGLIAWINTSSCCFCNSTVAALVLLHGTQEVRWTSLFSLPKRRSK